MAKVKNTAIESPKVSADILRKLDTLAVGISIVSSTANCVHLALRNQPSFEDRDLAIHVRHSVVKELRRLHKQTQIIMIALGGRLPFSESEELADMVE